MKSISDTIRIGVLGCSDIARRKFIPALAGSRNALLQAVSTGNPEAAQKLLPGCTIQSHDELLASPQIDLTYLSLPNHLHEVWAIKTLEAGKHLICEKPLALSIDSSQKILDCARLHNRLIYENQMFLFHPQHAIVKSIISDGKIGRVKELRTTFGFPMPREGDFRLDRQKGGGAFHDLARYPLGIATYLLDSSPEDFRGHSTWENGLDTAVTGTAKTADGAILSFTIRFGQQYDSSYEVIGENGRLKVTRAYTTPPDQENSIQLTSGNLTTEYTAPAADHFKLMIEGICNLILTGGDFSHLRDNAARNALLAEMMRQGCMER